MKVALESFAAPDGRVVTAGELVADGDPVMKGREDLFGAAPEPEAVGVEQATAAPGERRAGKS